MSVSRHIVAESEGCPEVGIDGTDRGQETAQVVECPDRHLEAVRIFGARGVQRVDA